jgi:hypothetical protein
MVAFVKRKQFRECGGSLFSLRTFYAILDFTMKRSLDELETQIPKKYKTEETLKRKFESEWIPTKKLKVQSERITLGELPTENRLQEIPSKEHRLILYPKKEIQYTLEQIPFPLYKEIEYPPDPSQMQVVIYNKAY